MNDETRHALNALNRAFYDQRGAAFDATRDHPWPGWGRALSAVADHAAQTPDAESPTPLRVLDLGCGNGRFGHFLMHRFEGPVDYLGLDSSRALLARAQSTLGAARADFAVRLAEQDFIEGDGPDALPPGPFDLVVVFGVLHHVPGEDMRKQLVRALASRLASGGTLVLTAWQFGGDVRFERTIWSDEALAERQGELDFDPADLDPDDYLLGFGGDGAVPRYCHFIDEDEFDRLIDGLPLDEHERYREDGKSHDLNAYRVLQRPM